MSIRNEHNKLRSGLTQDDMLTDAPDNNQQLYVKKLSDKHFLIVSDNNHYFVKDGVPFFWLGDTIWPAFSQYTIEELEVYFEHRRQQGFTVEHVALPWDGCFDYRHSDSTEDGEPLWLNGNPATPNEAFFKKVDKVIQIACERGLLLAILACGGASGTYIDKKKVITRDNARAYGRWLGQRYKDEPNIIWVNGFDMLPWMYEDVACEFSAGVKEGDGGNHIICYHPGGVAGISSNYFQQEEWLAANFIQTWSDYWNIYNMVSVDYYRKPNKPVVLVEGAYEAGTEYPTRPITSLIVRQQAYWAFLAGGFHTYGHNDIWRKTPYWKDSLNSLGSNQMRFLKDFFTSLAWWKLVPDQSVFAGENTTQIGHAAARSTDGDFVIVYFSNRATVNVDLNKIITGRSIRTEWLDPQSGKRVTGDVFNNKVIQSFTSPAWCEDAVLLLTAK